MTGSDGGSAPRGRLETWAPRVGLVVLPLAWFVLAATLPKSADRDLTIDVVCTSGNPVVNIWIESRSGGSGYAHEGEPGRALAKRYTFRQKFTGPYEVHVGCGGTKEQWGITVDSSESNRPYRRLVCNDIDVVGTRGKGCSDQASG